jgi:hypothetical protein
MLIEELSTSSSFRLTQTITLLPGFRLPTESRVFNSKVKFSPYRPLPQQANSGNSDRKKSSSMSSPTPTEKPSLSPQDDSSSSNSPPKRSQLAEDVLARAAANRDGPPRREKILPSERIDLSGRPGFATSGEWPRTKNIGGPVRILSKDGVLTELGKRAEQEQSAKSAAAKATSEEGGEREIVAGSAEGLPSERSV